jgi:hypothetical protein
MNQSEDQQGTHQTSAEDLLLELSPPGDTAVVYFGQNTEH